MPQTNAGKMNTPAALALVNARHSARPRRCKNQSPMICVIAVSEMADQPKAMLL